MSNSTGGEERKLKELQDKQYLDSIMDMNFQQTDSAITNLFIDKAKFDYNDTKIVDFKLMETRDFRAIDGTFVS